MEKIHENMHVFMLSCIKHACFHVFSPFSANILSCESHLVWLVFCGSQPYMFLHFCEMLFLELVSGDFLGEGGFFGIPYLHVL